MLRKVLLMTVVLTASCMPLAMAGPIDELVATANEEAYEAATYEVCVPDVQCTSLAALVTICILDLPCIHPSGACAGGLSCPALVEEALQCATGEPDCGSSGQSKIVGKIKLVLP